ncbi:hypothetical protein ACM9HF_04615 [Colwellia sp. RE-S-Sl-9]
MVSNRTHRIIAGVVFPPLVGACLFFFFTVLQAGKGGASQVVTFFVMIIGAFVLMGLPSILFSLIMEFCVQRISNNKIVIIVSMFLGVVCGVLFGVVGCIVGGATGISVGWYLRHHYVTS